jgi:hypothetical protein
MWYEFMLIAVLYILAHLAVYVALVRGSSWGKKERGIFLYHFCSFLIFEATTVALCAFSGFDLGFWISILAFHGIYSLTFLELWSLTQGSYSLQILEAAAKIGDLSHLRKLSELRELGNSKIQQRLAALSALRLIRGQAKNIKLTLLGSILASFFRLVLWLTGGRILKP